MLMLLNACHNNGLFHAVEAGVGRIQHERLGPGQRHQAVSLPGKSGRPAR